MDPIDVPAPGSDTVARPGDLVELTASAARIAGQIDLFALRGDASVVRSGRAGTSVAVDDADPCVAAIRHVVAASC